MESMLTVLSLAWRSCSLGRAILGLLVLVVELAEVEAVLGLLVLIVELSEAEVEAVCLLVLVVELSEVVVEILDLLVAILLVERSLGRRPCLLGN